MITVSRDTRHWAAAEVAGNAISRIAADMLDAYGPIPVAATLRDGRTIAGTLAAINRIGPDDCLTIDHGNWRITSITEITF